MSFVLGLKANQSGDGEGSFLVITGVLVSEVKANPLVNAPTSTRRKC